MSHVKINESETTTEQEDISASRNMISFNQEAQEKIPSVDTSLGDLANLKINSS